MTRSHSPLDRSSSESTSIDVPGLVARALAGKLRVPRFQRPFVWDAADVRRLFDSIYRGFPVGTLLLWKHPAPAELVSFGPVQFNALEDREALAVVDGQQRLTSLVASLAPGYAGRDERFEIYFDLAKRRFVGPARGMAPPNAIPVRETLDSRTLLGWLRENGDDLDSAHLEVADELAGAIRDYKFPAYIVEEGNEGLLREVFDRVNSAGKSMTRAQVFHALFANDSEPGSPATVVSELQRSGFGAIPENRVVQSLLALRGGNVSRDLHVEFDDNEDPADWYERTERALAKTIEFLRGEGVDHQLMLPTSFPLPVLAAFFHLHPEPAYVITTIMKRWLWRGFAGGFGTEEGQTPTLRRAIQSVNPKKGRPEAAPDEYGAAVALLDSVRDEAPNYKAPMPFRTDNASARLALIALASLDPIGPDGLKIDLSPLLEEHGAEAIGAFVARPRTELGNRGFWLSEWGNLSGYESADLLASHAVSAVAAEALRSGDLDEFVVLRTTHVTELVTNYLTNKVAPGSAVRRPIADLLVPDSEV